VVLEPDLTARRTHSYNPAAPQGALTSVKSFNTSFCVTLERPFGPVEAGKAGSPVLRVLTPPLSSLSNSAAARARRLGCALALVCFILYLPGARTSLAGRAFPADLRSSSADFDEPIVIAAEHASRWNSNGREILLVGGQVRLDQGRTHAQSQRAVFWIERGERNRVTAYFEGDVQVRGPSSRITDQSHLTEFFTTAKVDVRIKDVRPQSAADSPIYARALDRRDPRSTTGAIQRTQFEYTSPTEVAPAPASERAGGRRLRIFKRSDVPYQFESFPTGKADEQVAIITQGVNLIIDGVSLGGTGGGALDIATDRMVIWTTGRLSLDGKGQTEGDAERPFEIYMEGNIVFRQGDRVVYAERMYYDVRAERGVILDAELVTPAQEFGGKIRLKAEVVRQESKDKFFAQNAYITSSLMGRPGYRLQSSEIVLEDTQSPAFERFSGQPVVDPETGEQVINHLQWATGKGNAIYVGEAPVFYWPVFTSPLEDPGLFIERIQVRNDRIMGTQIMTDWNLLQILGVEDPPEGLKASISLDYLSLRGPAAGTAFESSGDDLLGILPGPYFSFSDGWYIRDHGLDTLGRGRMDLQPDRESRGRYLARFRQKMPNDFQLSAELGWISDFNFLEQYFENEWDEFKDEETDIELKQIRDQTSWSVLGSLRLNDFFLQTQWLPRGDHFLLGQSLLGDRLTYFEHTSLGYANYRASAPPPQPSQLSTWAPLPWEVSQDGARFVTDHEIDLPLSAGAFRVVPYARAQFAYWQNDLAGDSLDRFYFQGGVRASIPFWTVNPEVESSLFNVHGLAHKVVFDVDAYHADANEPVQDLALYDTLDDDDIEHFRRRLLFNTFGGVLPPQFDSRSYAIRQGLASSVTTVAPEVLDDLDVVRLGVRQRWQTKRGVPGQRKIIDWMKLDSEIALFPNPNRDNFGENVGLFNYDYSWHVGDRFTLLSDGALDFFPSGQQTFTMGGYLSRPPRGGVYLGFRWLEGPINSRVLTASYNYMMSPKWFSTFGTSFDFGPSGNIGQTAALTRIGESFLFTIGVVADSSKDNIGVNIGFQPRFVPRSGYGAVGLSAIPLAGVNGVE